MYEYLTKSIHATNPIQNLNTNETLRRGMSIAMNNHEKPAPPIRRTPSLQTSSQTVSSSNGSMEMQSRLKARLQRAEEIAGHAERIAAKVMTNKENHVQISVENDFPPPPADFLLTAENKSVPMAVNNVPTPNSSLLAEIQRGGFKLRKTAIDHDKSAPRLK